MSGTDDIEEGATGAKWLTPKRYKIGVTTAFVLAGGITGPLVFPDIHVARAILGGVIFGMFCTFCVLLHWFFD